MNIIDARKSCEKEMTLRVQKLNKPNTRTKEGTRLVCINSQGNDFLQVGEIYKFVEPIGTDMITVENERVTNVFARPDRFAVIAD